MLKNRPFFMPDGDETGGGGDPPGDSTQLEGTIAEGTVSTEVVEAAPSRDFIPEAYREKPWAEKIKAPEDVWKQYDEAQGLIGKKAEATNLPAADADDAAWDEYYKTTRPETEDAYEFEQDETTKNLIGEKGEDFDKKVKAIMFKNGLTKRQAEGVARDYSEAFTSTMGELTAAQAQAVEDDAKEFDTIAKERWGNDASKIQGISSNILKEFVDPKHQPNLANMKNSDLITMTQALYNMAQKYGVEENYIPDNNPTGDALSKEDISKRGTEIYQRMLTLKAEGKAMTPEYRQLEHDWKHAYDGLKQKR